MKPSVDPEKVAQREELARQMAEFEKKHGPIKTLPTTRREDSPLYNGGRSTEAQRRRGRRGLDSMGAK